MKTGKTLKTKKGRETRKRILTAARELMAESGSGNVTMEKIGEKAGVANCSVVWHFGSKENLCLEIFDDIVEEYDQVYQSYSFPDGDPMDMLERFLLDYADVIETYPELHAIFFSYVFNSKMSDKTGDRIRTMYADYRGIVAGRLKQFVPECPEDVASAILALLDGVFIQWHVDPEHVNIKNVFKGFLHIASIKKV